ncbi:MAG TPA: hypothetical protein VLE27_12600, partial [Thermoanaerobaculia bacterium]|nr:hypothetical protein [Thermoanaerobaculia bacterium]
MHLRRRATSLALAVWVSLTGLSPAITAEPPRPLSDRGLENLTAFARLLSLVRFFHPSDAAAAADWRRVAVAGAGAVEEPGNPAALARTLEDFFRLLAPTLRVYPIGQRPDAPEALRQPATGGPFKVVAWRHFGGRFDSPSKIFTSERIDDQSPPGFGTLVQAVAPGPLRGRQVRLSAEVRAEVQAGGFAQLGLRVDRAGGRPGFFDNMADRPIRDAAWRTYEIEGEVAPDAERIVVLLVLTGGGKVWIDNVSLLPVDGGRGAALANAGFEDGETGQQPAGWHFPYESIQAGYHLALRRGEPCRRGGCAEVAGDAIATPRFPRPDEVLEADLGGGVAAAVPLSLWADAAGTLPRPVPPAPAPPWAAIDPDADTRAARLAAVSLLWGIQQHLHPDLDPASPEWSSALPKALADAARATSRQDFEEVLNRLLAPLGDSRALIASLQADPGSRSLPLAWAWVEDRLVITGIGAEAGGLRVGDVIVSIDDKPAAEALAEAEARAAGPGPRARRWLALERLGRGPAGSRVALLAERPGASPLTATLTRESPSVPDTPLPPVAEPRPGVVYVDLRRISDADFNRLLPRLATARGVVFDLRGWTEVSNVLLSHLTARTARSSNWQVPVVMLPDH